MWQALRVLAGNGTAATLERRVALQERRSLAFWGSNLRNAESEVCVSPPLSVKPSDLESRDPSDGLLVEADHISGRVAESRCDLGRVRADRLRHFASIGQDQVKCRGHAVDHDVNEQAGLSGLSELPLSPRLARFSELAGLLLPLQLPDGVPALQRVLSGAGLHLAENVRMAANELGVEPVDDARQGEAAFLLGQPE
jgi:hypothetical protein